MSDLLEDRVILSGIGQSDVGRRLHRGELDLTMDACLEAINDAGPPSSDMRTCSPARNPA